MKQLFFLFLVLNFLDAQASEGVSAKCSAKQYQFHIYAARRRNSKRFSNSSYRPIKMTLAELHTGALLRIAKELTQDYPLEQREPLYRKTAAAITSLVKSKKY